MPKSFLASFGSEVELHVKPMPIVKGLCTPLCVLNVQPDLRLDSIAHARVQI